MPAYKDEKTKTWYCQFYCKNWQGVNKKIKKRGFETRKAALDYERSFKNKQEINTNISFENLCSNYIDDMKNELKATTIETKENIINQKILPYFKGYREISDITPVAVRHWKAEIMKKGYSDTYLKSINNQLSALFNYAIKFYGLTINPCHIAGSMGKKNATEMLFWTIDEYNQFIKCVDKLAYKVAFDIMFWTGMRVGEVLALTPSDIFDNIISVTKTYTKIKGQELITEPKTQNSVRTIPISQKLYDEIQDYIKKLYDIQPNDRIFYFGRTALNRALDDFAKIADVKRIRIHDLRHSHAALCINNQVDIYLLSKRLGHKDIQTTINTYGHLYPDKDREVIKALEPLI